jgi:hypothetical protein
MVVKKCVSGCKGFPTTICDGAPRCSYVNGNTRKYCRLSSKFKLGKPPKCNVTKRIQKSQIKKEAMKKIARFVKEKTRKKAITPVPSIKKKNPAEVIGRFMRNVMKNKKKEPVKKKTPSKVIGRFMLKTRKVNVKTPVNSIKKKTPSKVIGRFMLKTRKVKVKSPVQSIKKKTPSKVIGRFMLKTGDKRKLTYLKAICSDSGVCIAFGQNSKKIINYFDGFKTFDYVKLPITQIGNPSVNGFVKQIQYEKNGYNAYTVLKSSAKPDGDNLVYEYLVGQFINNANTYFPCFIETYGLYYYKSDLGWDQVKNTKVINTNMLKDVLELQTNIYDYKKMCKESKLAAILIQHLKDVSTLDDIISKGNHFIVYDLLYVLYQIYMPLSKLKASFTHYDLHSNNVLLYEPVKGKYLEYYYHLENNQVVNFKSSYLVKLIDYGRSYFNPGTTSLNPTEIYNNLCGEPACTSKPPMFKHDCGSNYGFAWFDPSKKLKKEDYYINTMTPNQSHDLRILKFLTSLTVSNKFKRYIDPRFEVVTNKLAILINMVEYGKGLKKNEQWYGAKETTTSGLPSKINNVSDAEQALRTLILTSVETRSLNNIKYKPENKIGSIHVYIDGTPLKYEPV